MNISSAIVKLRLFEVYSLKEKRQIVKSIIERLRNRYNISIAEIDSQELHNLATIGFACVSNDRKLNHVIIDSVIEFIDGDYRVEIIEIYIES